MLQAIKIKRPMTVLSTRANARYVTNFIATSLSYKNVQIYIVAFSNKWTFTI